MAQLHMQVRRQPERGLLERDWLRMNSRAARNAALAMRSDARRAMERAEAERALAAHGDVELRQAQ
jgi:hypothetical protein